LQGLTGKSSSGGLSAEMNKSLIDIISAKGTAGAGKILLQQAAMQSPIFRAEVNGTVTIANVLSNSPIDLPVTILLERTVAQSSRLAPADTGSDEKYVRLPTFLTMRGTLGDPKKDINKTVLLGMAAQEATDTFQDRESAARCRWPPGRTRCVRFNQRFPGHE
jgi:hypothetical protein